MSEVNWMNREKYLHEKVFDTLGRPLSRAASRQSKEPTSTSPCLQYSSSCSVHNSQMLLDELLYCFAMFSGRKIKWNHFGKKYALRFSDYEMEYADLYDALLKKIREIRPDFEGDLAFIDLYGRQVIVTSDKDIREAITQSKGKLKLHTTLRDGAVISAADMAEAARRPARSQSVPPERSYNTYSQRSPSSMDSAPATEIYRPRAMSPPPMSTTTTHSPPPRELVKTTYSHHGSFSGGYSGYPGYKYPYSQSILYGMPPHNNMLWRFLANPFPFGHHQSRGTFIGPNKYHHFGGYNHAYNAWGGPVW